MRVRKKLIFLHTCFSLVLAGVLAVALYPASTRVVRESELHEARLVLSRVIDGTERAPDAEIAPGVFAERGDAAWLGLTGDTLERAAASTGEDPHVVYTSGGTRVIAPVDGGEFVSVRVRLERARRAVLWMYGLATLALLGVYALVAASLELFVLPKHVYGPIRTMLLADRAVQGGDRSGELIPESAIPADELGEIMRSRNDSVRALREHEVALADAVGKLAETASDLKRKNHLLERAKQNLADADRLANLGMMSAGIAHELNTPLAVLKGLVEKLDERTRAGVPQPVSATEAALMVRVLSRLERLSEGLLDFARVRSPASRVVGLRGLAQEAWDLVAMDRAVGSIGFENRIGGQTRAYCDADRIVQVLVNLLRNSADAIIEGGSAGRGIVVEASGVDLVGDRIVEPDRPESSSWVSVRVIDDGPGVESTMLSRLFEPFASTRLDARGTGLGLAVAEGIVREHGGVIVARNRPGGVGAEFEFVLPAGHGDAGDPVQGRSGGAGDPTLNAAANGEEVPGGEAPR